MNPIEYSRLRSLTARELVAALQRHGFIAARQRGSHHRKVELHTRRYEDEDGRLKVYPPSCLSEAEEERLEEVLTERCVEILGETNLFILCAVFDSQR
jgi:predicted RNA binding protein YcfA (HicA-like mRNA interferase family)